MDLKQSVLKISDNPALLAKLRRKDIGRLHKDEKGREFLEAQFNGIPYKFYIGVPRTFAYAVAHGFRRDNLVPIDEPCKNCKGTGSTPTGLCFECKGKKIIFTGELVPIFEIVREFDPMVVDPESVEPSAQTAAASE
jgi:hypothetical protein